VGGLSVRKIIGALTSSNVPVRSGENLIFVEVPHIFKEKVEIIVLFTQKAERRSG